ncbi:ABC transporter permease [Pseudomonas aeruginosa]|uniref:ABC transporter permease n=1 Tax=Pseudomonas aeruginosa TaxID=287 RepID=UPI000F833639|nr:ABC transporter permease [Pseudomonas aeruginosa]RTT13482.1 ABC transporter permease [Pseudomonas aeruginosa]
MKGVFRIFYLGIKEFTCLRRDYILVLFLIYTFSLDIYMPAAGSVIGVQHASIAIIDEDKTQTSRIIAESIHEPIFQKPVNIKLSESVKLQDSGTYTFVIHIPQNFESELLANKRPELLINVDATAMSQAFIGAAYIQEIILEAIDRQLHSSMIQPVNIVTRTLFNENLQASWFLAITQIAYNITIMGILLTGTALLREREHGTIDHLLVLPLKPQEIILSKVWSNTAVIIAFTWLSIEVIVKGFLDIPLPGSIGVFLLAAVIYLFACTTIGILLATFSRSTPQFGLLAIPVVIPMLLLSGGTTPIENMPTWLQVVLHLSPTTHFIELSISILLRDTDVSLVFDRFLAISAIGICVFIAASHRFRRFLV